MKERLDISFHNKIAAINNQNQEHAQLLRLENMTIRDKEMHNRRIIESIESNLKIKVSKEPKIQESDICQAYQILLSEHYKRANRKLKENSTSMKIKIKMDNLAENKPPDEDPADDKDNDAVECRSEKKISKKKQGKNVSSIYIMSLIKHSIYISNYHLPIVLGSDYFREE